MEGRCSNSFHENYEYATTNDPWYLSFTAPLSDTFGSSRVSFVVTVCGWASPDQLQYIFFLSHQTVKIKSCSNFSWFSFWKHQHPPAKWFQAISTLPGQLKRNVLVQHVSQNLQELWWLVSREHDDPPMHFGVPIADKAQIYIYIYIES